ncbi:NADH-quinone oxidoreductase subunit L, partial [bacterium]|nr:NADH-quinone oxidoreductase subunit L [bacterium]
MNFIVLTFLIPLCGAAINGLLGGYLKRISGTVACLAMFLSFIAAATAFYLDQTSPLQSFTMWNWFPIGEQSNPVGMRVLVDHLSLAMALMVTFVGFLIHVFSVGYMENDPSQGRFFCYLNLFVAFMLLLVFSSNLLMMYVFWEGVGLMSYLLIGFWYQKPSAAAAGKKAFIMNRIGDTGFALAMFWIYSRLNTFDIYEIANIVQNPKLLSQLLPPQEILGITLLLFLAVTGKSAQIPLFTWLPDAMEGPTPVSALIHAATMVTAGIYMVARNYALFDACELTRNVMLVIGTATALLSAGIALGQRDIKKVLAYSTVSQLGFMVMSLGVGCYIQAVFHLLTHAFFKALLFLTAGAVIHGLHHEQDMGKMGGLYKKMPLTAVCFVFGALALAGFPLTSGFFSKDAILMSVVAQGHTFAWMFGCLAAVFTGF